MPALASELSRTARIGYFTANLVLRGFLLLVLLIPYRWRIPFMGWFVARIAGPLAGYHRRIRRNLALTETDLTKREVARLCQAVSDNAGRTLIEIYSGKEFVDHAAKFDIEGPGLAALIAAQEAGRPAFVASGHFGNYYAVRANLARRGFDTGGLYRRMANPYFNDHYVESMKVAGDILFAQGKQGMRALLRHLRSGGIVAILHDLHAHGGEELTFFGQPAVTSIATTEMALRYGAVVIPCYGIRCENGLDFRIVMHDPIPHTDPKTMSQALNDDLEAMTRKHMDQWFWIHRRWKPWYGLGHPDG